MYPLAIDDECLWASISATGLAPHDLPLVYCKAYAMLMGWAQCAYARAVARLPRAGLMRNGVRIWCTDLGRASFRCDARRDDASKSADGLWRCTCAAVLCTGAAQVKGRLGGHRIASGSLSRPHRTDAIELATLMEALQEGVTSDWCCARPARRHVGLICNPHTCVDASLESLPDRQSRSQIGRRCRFLSSDHRGGCLGVDGSKSGNDRPTAFLHLG
ncbi:hypothetical protein BUPH_05507 [Paraburkholderia phenoliruptrix BR3459a]|uniref:Uncharacterized protein n=1 Tax=Paraburkholderia phenoliruptrix BR3459a TaxID=1229205 RepID=K0DJC7_9BURK|nr:hypothetical protein BUPH_05507 [Paraburkholderia phenoliruptrix BR3459a]